ncbi:MAG: carbohydrate kinase family protein [Candidatus Altiarchaeota archaeon]|nr:carbohydrate kinase family protein [Candidatus Altiarchaeota archaeon]
MPDVIGFGALNLDRLCYVKKTARPGEHQPVESMLECPGGSAANTIAWLADSGFKTGFIGALGNDIEGQRILEDFKKRGVDIRNIQTAKAGTGVTTGLVDEKGERTLYPHPGANSLLKTGRKEIEYAKTAKIIHLSSFVDDMQFNGQKKLVKQLSDKTVISLSPGDLYTKKGLKKLRPLLERCGVLILNKKEIEQLTGTDYKSACKKLSKLGVKQIAVTLGPKGCYIHCQDKGTPIPCKKIRPLDTTGAGDAYNAGYLTGILKGKTPLESGRLGNQTAAKCITHKGARQTV